MIGAIGRWECSAALGRVQASSGRHLEPPCLPGAAGAGGVPGFSLWGFGCFVRAPAATAAPATTTTDSSLSNGTLSKLMAQTPTSAAARRVPESATATAATTPTNAATAAHRHHIPLTARPPPIQPAPTPGAAQAQPRLCPRGNKRAAAR